MSFKIGICDDEQSYIDAIKEIVKNHFKNSGVKYSVHEYHSGEELLDADDALNLLFLDIEMEEASGIDVKNAFTLFSKDCSIVFVSNYEQRIYDAFGKNVVAFINKTNLSKIETTLDKFEKEHNEHKIIEISGFTLDTYDILYVKASGSYSSAYTMKDEYMCCVYLRDFFQRLASSSFIKVHRSYVVHMKYIKSITKDRITLVNNVEIPISYKYRSEVPLKYFSYIRRNSS